MTSIEWLIEQLIPEDQHEGIMDIIEEAKEMEEQQTEISDEEIEKAARDYDNAVIYGPPLLHFEQGAFWYREQLKTK